MNALEDAIAEIERARESVTDTEVRTKLDSINTSLQEMLDTAAGEETDGDIAFADSDVAGTAPTGDNLRELEENLLELAERTDHRPVRDHLEAAQRRVESYRTGPDEAV